MSAGRRFSRARRGLHLMALVLAMATAVAACRSSGEPDAATVEPAGQSPPTTRALRPTTSTTAATTSTTVVGATTTVAAGSPVPTTTRAPGGPRVGSTAAPPAGDPAGGPGATQAPPETNPPPPPPPPQTSPPPPPTAPPGAVPASVLDLTNWKLTLPVAGSNGSALEIKQPQLASFSSEEFKTAGSSVVFTAPVTGATTSGSSYPRSELREMTNGGRDNASWSSTAGSHVMEITQAISRTPQAKPDVVAGQIHDSGDDVVMIRLEGQDLFVEGDGDRLADLDGGYVLGTTFTVRIEVANGHIKVAYNGVEKLDHAFSGSGLYFKAGAYTQSNASKGEPPGAVGQVSISALRVTHS